MEEASGHFHLRLRAPARIRSHPARGGGSVRIAGVGTPDKRGRFGGGDLPDGGYECRDGGFDRGRKIRMGGDPGGLGIDGGQAGIRVGFVGRICIGDGNCGCGEWDGGLLLLLFME